MQGQQDFHDKVSVHFRRSGRVPKHDFWRRLRDVLDGAFCANSPAPSTATPDNPRSTRSSASSWCSWGAGPPGPGASVGQQAPVHAGLRAGGQMLGGGTPLCLAHWLSGPGHRLGTYPIQSPNRASTRPYNPLSQPESLIPKHPLKLLELRLTEIS